MKKSLLFSIFASMALLGNAQVHVALTPQCANETSHATVLSAPKKANVDYFQYGFCRTGAEYGYIGIQAAVTYRFFLQMPKEEAAKYAGDKVLGLNFGLGSLTNATAKVFVAEYFADDEADFLTVEKKKVTPQSWNTINFSNAYTITGDKDLYFGVEVTATASDWPIPAVENVVGNEVNSMFAAYGKFDPADSTHDVWACDYMCNSGFGPCAINVVLAGDAQPTNDIVLSDISMKSSIASDYAAPVRFSVFNPSVNQIDSFDVVYTLNDGEEHTVNMPCWILPNATGSYSIHLDPIAEGGDYNIKFSIANPNGVADTDDSNNSWAGSFNVNADIYPRTVLLEEFTATGCGYCPAGAARLNAAIEGRDDVIMVCHHATKTLGAGDPMRSQMQDEYTTKFQVSGLPSCMYDRTTFTGTTPVANVGAVEDISAMIDKAYAVGTKYKVEATPSYNADTRCLSVDVKAFVKGEVSDTDKDVFFNVFLVEDGVQTAQAGVTGLYTHNHVSRVNLAGIWGEKVVWDGNESTKTFTYTVPEPDTTTPAKVPNMDNCYIVAFLSNYSASSRNNCKVLNSVKAIIPECANSAVSTVDAEQAVNVVGAQGAIVVEGEAAGVKVYGIDGSLKAQSAQAGSIAVAPGLYIVKAGNTVKKVIVK